MARLTIKAFGIAKEIVGGKEIAVELASPSVKDLRATLQSRFPKLTGLRSLLIAVNNRYADDDLLLSEDDEIAMIPPVSGG